MGRVTFHYMSDLYGEGDFLVHVILDRDWVLSYLADSTSSMGRKILYYNITCQTSMGRGIF